MGRFEANLPAVLEPEGEICVNVKIPNHPDYVKLFLRAMRMLEVNRMYERDDAHSAKIVCDQWRNRTLTPLVESLATGTGCPDENSECLEFPAYAGFIHYFPDNPYIEEPAPPGYLLPAWWRWGNLDTALPDFIEDFLDHQIEQFTGYRNNDAICWISSLLSLNWFTWLDSGYVYPAIEIEVTGSGTIEIALLSFPLGSRAIIELDEAPNPIDILTGGIFDPNSFIVDTARDVLSYPPEEYPEIRFRIEVPDDGDHTLYILFLPVIDPELSEDLIGFGGGLRSVELCGGLRPRGVPEPEPPPLLDGVTELKPEFRFTSECGLEYQLRDQENEIVQTWQPVAGWIDNAAACFAGNDGADGTDGTDGTDGEDCEDCGGDSGNTFPPPPEDYEEEGAEPEDSKVCGASYYIAQQLYNLIEKTLTDAATITQAEFLEELFGIGGFDAGILVQLWDMAVANSNPSLAADSEAAIDTIAEAFFCGLLDREHAIEEIEASSLASDVKAAYLGALNSVTDGKLANWSFVGGETLSEDCSEFCSWVVVWDFNGSYTPVGDEDAIYNGNNWIVTNGEYESSVGYRGLDDVWTIQHELPPDCRVASMVHNCNKNALCSAVDIATTWRGVSGTDAEQFTAESRVLSNTPVNQNWTVVSTPELTQMTIRHNHFFCGGANYGSQTHYVRMVGTGSKPSQ